MSKPRSIQDELRDPVSALFDPDIYDRAADRIDALEKALRSVDEWASDKSKYNERSVIAEVRATLASKRK
jgi:hypothetical protein